MSRPPRHDVEGILLIYHFVPPYASTVIEHVDAFVRHSSIPVWTVNTNEDFPATLDRFRFRAIVLHYSLFGSSEYFLGEQFREYVDASDGSLRIAFFQDEYYYCRQRFAFIDRYRIDWIFTLLRPAEAAFVYGRCATRPRLVTTLPGYVSDELPAMATRLGRPADDRPVDVGYRARPLPFYMGRGAQEKSEIGRGFLQRAAGSGLTMDISIAEEDRLYGDDWYRFLGSCRGVLGVEAGVSIFDLDDSVREATTRLLEREPGVSFEEVSRRVLADKEDNVYYRTISPRHFEAAAFGTCQILFVGSYSEIMKAGVHYIPLQKDFANLDEAVATLKNDARRRGIVAAARQDLIESGRYSYARFIAGFDHELRLAGAFGTAPARSPEVDAALGRGALRRRLKASLRTRYRRWREGRRAAKPYQRGRGG